MGKVKFVLITLPVIFVLDAALWAQSGPAKDLSVGNLWVYWETNDIEKNNPPKIIIHKVISDTLLNNCKYAVIEGQYDWSFQRADSSKIYELYPANMYETVLCDFNAVVGDTLWIGSSPEWLLPNVAVTVYSKTYWGRERRFVELFHELSYLERGWVLYAEGIGILSTASAGLGLGGAFYSDLKGAVLSGIVFGDTATVISRVAKKSSYPGSIHLYQNYPNPFNSSTTIHYRLENKNQQKVRLSIYSLNGKEVRCLVDEMQNEGEYEVHWDGGDQTGKEVPSGTYLCVLKADEKLLTIKQLLLR